jgi:hypothetical protein
LESKPQYIHRAHIGGLFLATRYGERGDHMTDHLKEVSPAAVLLGREIVSVDAETREVRLRFLADQFGSIS